MSDRRIFIRSLALLLGGAAIAPKLMAEEPIKNSGEVPKKLMNAPVKLGISSSPYGNGAYERYKERQRIAAFEPRKGMMSRYVHSRSKELKGPLPPMNWDWLFE